MVIGIRRVEKSDSKSNTLSVIRLEAEPKIVEKIDFLFIDVSYVCSNVESSLISRIKRTLCTIEGSRLIK